MTSRSVGEVMYLQNFLRFCSQDDWTGPVVLEEGRVATTFLQVFRRAYELYQISGTAYHADFEFEFLTETWLPGHFFTDKVVDDMEILDAIVGCFLHESKKHSSIADLLAKVYWCFLKNDSDGVWDHLVAYCNKAVRQV